MAELVANSQLNQPLAGRGEGQAEIDELPGGSQRPLGRFAVGSAPGFEGFDAYIDSACFLRRENVDEIWQLEVKTGLWIKPLDGYPI